MQNDMRDRLVRRLRDWGITEAEALADYLIANGVILPPCEVGDEVYKINGNHIEKIKIARFVISSFGINAEDLRSIQVVNINDFGKTVFLTKDQAEQKLKEMRADHG